MDYLKGLLLAVALWLGAVAAGLWFWRDGSRAAAVALGVVAIALLWWFRRLSRRRRRRRASNRVPIPAAVRRQVYARDRSTCVYCGRSGRGIRLTIDHVFPVALGGTNELTNLVTACRACNLTKGARDLDDGGLRRYAAERRAWAGRERRRGCLVRTIIAATASAVLIVVVSFLLGWP